MNLFLQKVEIQIEQEELVGAQQTTVSKQKDASEEMKNGEMKIF